MDSRRGASLVCCERMAVGGNLQPHSASRRSAMKFKPHRAMLYFRKFSSRHGSRRGSSHRSRHGSRHIPWQPNRRPSIPCMGFAISQPQTLQVDLASGCGVCSAPSSTDSCRVRWAEKSRDIALFGGSAVISTDALGRAVSRPKLLSTIENV